MIRSLLLSTLLLTTSATAPTNLASDDWQPKRDYQELRMPPHAPSAAGKVQVIEFFNFACGHCNDFEPYLRKWREHAARYIDVQTMPAIFGKEDWRAYARLHYTLQALGREDLRAAVFAAIHSHGTQLATIDPPQSFERQLAFAEAHGVRAADFTRIYHSAAIDNQVAQADELSRYYKVSSVPALLVAGKYLSKPDWVGGPERLFALVDALIAREHKAGAAPAER
jgi:thiol:disulfide interchange protein DsbA